MNSKTAQYVTPVTEGEVILNPPLSPISLMKIPNSTSCDTFNKVSHQARRWCFTLNNWTQEEYEYIIKKYKNIVVGKEIGKNGTPHLQGYIEFPTAKRFSTLHKELPRAHLEPAKGNREDNLAYCTKEYNFFSTFPLSIKEQVINKQFKDIVWKDWQQDILNLLKEEPDDRTIHWYWERNGGIGKTLLCKYIALNDSTIIGSGKKNDVFNQIKTLLDENKMPEVVVLDFPRFDIERINYGSIEQIKNGLLYSGKYEGGKCIFTPPHVIIFANEPPETHSLSADRWHIVCLDKTNQIEENVSYYE